MEFFDYLNEKCKEPVENIVWSCCEGDYRLTYKIFPADPNQNHFIFYGPKHNSFVPCELFSVKTPDKVVDSMKSLYPDMHDEDWDTLDKLYRTYRYASKIVCFNSSDAMKRIEEQAREELLNFYKKHGLEY